ncbi:hypothetical protein OROMI_003835 [Orobanche minor]
MKVLSLTCSSSACERNWSTFNQESFTYKDFEQVSLCYNKRLKSRWLKTSLKEDEDPLVLDEIPSDDEWMVDENGLNNYGSVLTDNIGDELVEGENGDNEHVREVNEDGGRGRVGGRTRGRGIGRGRGRGRGKRKRDALDKGRDDSMSLYQWAPEHDMIIKRRWELQMKTSLLQAVSDAKKIYDQGNRIEWGF